MDEARHSDPAGERRSRATAIAGCAVLAIGSLGVLYCWFWVVTIGLAFGPRFGFWAQLGGVIGSLAVMVPVSVWLSRGRVGPLRWPAWIAAIAIGWTLVGIAIWMVLGSPFSQSRPILIGYAASTWWLLWVWLMFLVRWPKAARSGVLAVLVAIACAFFAAVRGDGLDGNALPRLTWRMAPVADDPQQPRRLEIPIEAGPFDDVGDDELRDYPRFRGTDGLGTLAGENLARDWLRRKPKLRWRHQVGEAWSSMVLAGKRIFTQEQRGDQECVVCYSRASGGQLWVHRDAAHYRMPTTGGGPRATPTVDGESVFTLGATGILNCLDRRSGKRRWTVEIVRDTRAQPPIHGMVSSPLVVGDMVVVSAGGTNHASLVAYAKTTGKRVWAGGDDTAGYTSPQLVELDGVRQIAIVTPRRVVAHDVASGAVLWSAPLENATQTNCSQPCPVGGNRLFASTNYGTGCTLLEVSRDGDAWNARSVWASRAMQTKFCSALVRDDHAYGLDDGILECISLADGRRRWKQGRYGHGQLLLADDLLVVVAEDGRVALVEAKPEKFTELGSFQALDGRTWNYPALAGGELFVRNDREAACYELPREND